MKTEELTARFAHGRMNQQKGIFSMLMIAADRLQTLFDEHIPNVSLKQFLLLSVIRQAPGPLSLTELGELTGRTRQNAKKLAESLEKKGFVTLVTDKNDRRIVRVVATPCVDDFFEGAFVRYKKQLGSLFEGFPDEEVATLYQLLARLLLSTERFAEVVSEEAPGSAEVKNRTFQGGGKARMESVT